MNEKDRPIKCKIHIWTPFLDYKLETTNLAPLQYHRICENCGKIELRDKLKEWEEPDD